MNIQAALAKLVEAVIEFKNNIVYRNHVESKPPGVQKFIVQHAIGRIFIIRISDVGV